MGRLVKETIKKTTYKYDKNGNVIEKVEEVTEKKYEEDYQIFEKKLPGLNEPWKNPGVRGPYFDDGIAYLNHKVTCQADLDALINPEHPENPFRHGPITRYEQGKAIKAYEN